MKDDFEPTKRYSEVEIKSLLMKAVKTPGGMEALKETVKTFMPPEYAKVMLKIIEGELVNKNDIKEATNNEILDSFNKKSRTKEDMEILFKGKLSTEETRRLLKKNEAKRK